MNSTIAGTQVPPEVLRWIAIVFPLFFLTVWFLTFALIARFGGWSVLAKKYPARLRPGGLAFRWRSARFFRAGGYNNCLNVTLSDTGIHVVPAWVFSFKHPPLLLPWSAVTGVSESGIGWRQCAIEITLPERKITLCVPASATETVKGMWAAAQGVAV